MQNVSEPISIQHILNNNNSYLSRIIKKAASLQHLTYIFQKTVNLELSQNCQIAKFDKKTLVIIVNNATWATNLRFMIPDIIKNLRTQPEFKDLEKIQYRLDPYLGATTVKKKISKSANAVHNAKRLREFAKTLDL